MKKIYQSGICLALAGTMALMPSVSAYAMMQDESVYVKLQANGEAKDISVIEHLINDLKESQLFDQSTLQGIENLNGFETFSADGENIKWEANGKDIYYRGTSQKELPIKLEITYKLDGEEKSIDEVLGKNGHIEIQLKYTNLSKVGSMYTPFVAAVATTLNEDKVSNVKVTNGKATSNGRTIAVAGVAAPGLYESLGLAELETADTVTISFDTNKFELGDIYTIVTPKLLESADLQAFSELDDLYTKTNQLSASSKQLVSGTAQLESGIKELRSSVAKLKAQLGGAAGAAGAESLIDEVTLGQIKAQAGQAAAAEMEAKKATMVAMIMQQLQQNTSLVGALQAAGAPGEAVLRQLAESSFELAKQTAITTAEATASNLTNTLATAIQSSVSQTLVSIPDLLLAGIDQLVAGASELSAGMAQFDREGIQTLTNFVNDKVKVTTNKIKQLVALAEDYNNYAGIAPEVEGTTKFIMMVEGRK